MNNYNILVSLPHVNDKTSDLYIRSQEIFAALEDVNKAFINSRHPSVQFVIKRFDGQRIGGNDIGIIAFSDNVNYSDFRSCGLPVMAIAAGNLDGVNIFRWYYPIETIGFAVGKFIRFKLDGYNKYYIAYINYEIGVMYKNSLKASSLIHSFEELPFPLEGSLPDDFLYKVENDLRKGERVLLTVMGHGLNYSSIIKKSLVLKKEYGDRLVVVVESNYTVLYNNNEEYDASKMDIWVDYCITGLVSEKNIFVQFANESIPLFYRCIERFQKRSQGDNDRGNDICSDIMNDLRRCKYYQTLTLGDVHYREDGELFLPLFVYDGRLNNRRRLADNCSYCHREVPKELVGDRLRELDIESVPLARLNVPRDLDLRKDADIESAIIKCSEIIARLADSLFINYISKYIGTGEQFYQWTKRGVDVNLISTTSSVLEIANRIGRFPIQINLQESDLEDNDAQRIYLVLKRRDSFYVKTLDEVINTELTNATAIVCAKSRSIAREEYLKIAVGNNPSVFSGVGVKHLIEKLFDEFISYRRIPKANFLYYIPDGVDTACGNIFSRGQGGIVMVTRFKLSLFDLQIVTNMVSRVFYLLQTSLSQQDVRQASIKSAIGSIMSRNGSHNIGSHVLAALSHNVGTLPDDRVLYQYIQQRMDYIATVTTDFPTWTQSTMFVADMMKTFLSQRHLLDHIVESEGLRGFQFQNPNMTDEEWKAQKNCVKIHVRRKKGEKYKELIDYTKRDAKVLLQEGSNEYDVSLAIPGGIIGEHAFYTILENIIRNAAKHAWAPLSQEDKKEYGNLELYIDFEDCNSEIKFTVYTKLPLKNDESKRIKDNSSEKCNDIKSWVEKFDNPKGLETEDQKDFDNLPIHHRQQIMLARSFIDSQGDLRRENWGLAEMKISAGYLAGKEIDVIGGLKDEKDEKGDIIEPCIIPCIIKEEDGKKEEDVKQYFGYKFSIAKPKEILIIAQSMDDWGDDDVHKDLEKQGIFIRLWNEIIKASDAQSKRLNYRYVVHYDANEMFGKDKKPKDGILPPFRILSGEESNYGGFIPKIEFAALQKAIKKDNSDSIRRKEEIERIVYQTYLNHLLTQRKIQKIGLLVTINENEKSGGNSLISDADILELMLEQNFAICVDQYKAFAVSDDSRTIFEWLDSIRHKSSDASKVIKFKHLSNKTIRELIAQRMYDWMNEDENESSGKDAKGHLKEKYYTDEAAENDNGGEKKPSDSKKGNDDFDAKVNALLKRHPIDDFIRYVESVFENTKKLFKQYEEQIVTLPAGYKVDNRSSEEDGNASVLGFKINYKASDVEKDENPLSWIAYRRHDCTLSVNDESKAEYVEPLSGTQTYLTQLAKVKDDIGLQMRLIENGLMRILVLDERVAKFLREHQKEVGPHYQSMNINVVDHEWVESGSEDKRRPDWSYSSFSCETKEALRKYVDNDESTDQQQYQLTMFADVDILIVHQGILDKWFEEFKSDKDKMRKLLEGFKKLVKYVVVTTGRGTPVNIPEEAHLLPFAVVESTLFKKYPEKLILTDTIMNVLPVGMKNGNTGDKK